MQGMRGSEAAGRARWGTQGMRGPEAAGRARWGTQGMRGPGAGQARWGTQGVRGSYGGTTTRITYLGQWLLAEELVVAPFNGQIYRFHICKPEGQGKVRGRSGEGLAQRARLPSPMQDMLREYLGAPIAPSSASLVEIQSLRPRWCHPGGRGHRSLLSALSRGVLSKQILLSILPEPSVTF